MSAIKLPKFKSSAGSSFYYELRTNVESYFKENNISKFANGTVKTKSVILILAYFGSYVCIFTLGLPVWAMWLLCVLMGLSMAGIGMGVMHDANHGSFSKNKFVNKIFGKTADILGVSSNNWINQHNKLHHTYTNIYEHDEDVNGKGLFRFTPDAPLKKVHKHQYWYWAIFYGFLTLGWFFADFQAYKKYIDRGLNRAKGAEKRKQILEIAMFKAIFITYMIVLPIIFVDIAWWQVLLGFLTVEFTAGLVLAVIFSLAHVVDKFDLSDHDKFEGASEDEWAIHQIKNTFNFATGNKILTWFCGGLNYQIEHHLFPNISHAHYPKLYKIIKETAQKHGVNYQEFRTFREALYSHLVFLYKLGRPSTA